MNPYDRKLRLRRTTVRRIDPEAASRARGGAVVFDDGSGFWCTWSLFACPEPTTYGNTECQTCACVSREASCDDDVSCATEPHVGCCPYTATCQPTGCWQSYCPTCENSFCQTCTCGVGGTV